MAISGTTTPAQMESYYKGSVVNAAEFLRNILQFAPNVSRSQQTI